MVKAIVESTVTGRRRLRSGLNDNSECGVTLPQQKQQNPPSVSKSKADFVLAVSRTSSVLAEQYGYSRERATSALLTELSRGVVPPNDEEVFRTMHRCGVGSDEAVKILTVSRALKKRTAENGCSLDEAIDDLTSKLTLTNLVRHKGDSSEPCIACDNVSSPRIQPVAALPPPRAKSPQQPTSRKTKSIIKVNKAKVKTPVAAVISKNVTIVRKRPIDDISNQVETRDHVVSAVNAKFAEKTKKPEDDNIAADSASLRTVAGVRAKRNRSDDTDTCTTPPGSLKRARTLNDA